MLKTLIPLVALIVAANGYAAGFDLKATMKAMKMEFNQAADAQTIDEMKVPISKLTELINQAKQGAYPLEKQALYLEGFNKLTVRLNQIEDQLNVGDLDKAKQELRYVDELREEYHDKRNPSIWSKIFG